jgi:hypothetical protein
MYKPILLFFWLWLPSLVSAATYPWTAKSPIADLTYCSKFQEAFVSQLGSASTDLFYPSGDDDFIIPPGTAMIAPFLVPPGVKSMSIDTSIIVMGYATTSIIGEYPQDLLCDDVGCSGFSLRDPANNFKSGGNRLTATLFTEPQSLNYARQGYFIVYTNPQNPANFFIGPYNISLSFDKKVDIDGDGVLDDKQGDVLFREWRDQGCPVTSAPPVVVDPPAGTDATILINVSEDTNNDGTGDVPNSSATASLSAIAPTPTYTGTAARTFTVPAGTYNAILNLPAGYELVSSPSNVTVTSGENKTINFVIRKQVISPTSAIINISVLEDTDNNGTGDIPNTDMTASLQAVGATPAYTGAAALSFSVPAGSYNATLNLATGYELVAPLPGGITVAGGDNKTLDFIVRKPTIPTVEASIQVNLEQTASNAGQSLAGIAVELYTANQLLPLAAKLSDDSGVVIFTRADGVSIDALHTIEVKGIVESQAVTPTADNLNPAITVTLANTVTDTLCELVRNTDATPHTVESGGQGDNIRFGVDNLHPNSSNAFDELWQDPTTTSVDLNMNVLALGAENLDDLATANTTDNPKVQWFIGINTWTEGKTDDASLSAGELLGSCANQNLVPNVISIETVRNQCQSYKEPRIKFNSSIQGELAANEYYFVILQYTENLARSSAVRFRTSAVELASVTQPDFDKLRRDYAETTDKYTGLVFKYDNLVAQLPSFHILEPTNNAEDPLFSFNVPLLTFLRGIDEPLECYKADLLGYPALNFELKADDPTIPYTNTTPVNCPTAAE